LGKLNVVTIKTLTFQKIKIFVLKGKLGLRHFITFPNLFPSLARRFPFHSAPFGLGLDGLTEQSAKL